MARHFNTTGPCIPAEHYMLPPEARCVGVKELIEQKYFFVIHAPRQSGKTTLLKHLARQINAGNKYHAIYCSLESVQGIDEIEKGIPAIQRALAGALKYHTSLSGIKYLQCVDLADGSNGLKMGLADLCSQLNRPLALFFDEADCLGGPTLISFLRQLRDGYINRDEMPFPHSLVLIGMRNIRDYRIQVRPDSQTLGSASPFNIAKESLTLKNFSREEIAALYQQHTEDTGQKFPAEFTDYISEMTQGQPWLVNAIAAEVLEKLCRNDFQKTLTPAMAEEAIQRIILRRDTHIDSLLARLDEERVQKIIEPVLLGEGDDIEELSSDYQFVRDLGLIRNDRGVIRISNPIYSEVISRTLNYDLQNRLDIGYINCWMDGKNIDISGLLKGFQGFWRDNSEAWRERFQYKEAAPHLILMAFLQRAVNGGARIDREYATGTRRVDICVTYKEKRYPLELKLVRSEKTREEGLKQLAGYMETLGCNEGWLLLFDLKSSGPWEQRIYSETVEQERRTIHVFGA
jgi:hypothetical protein